MVKTAGGLTSRLYHQLTGCFCVSDFPTCNRRVSHTSYSTGLLSDVAQHDEHPMSIRCSCPVLQGGSGALRKPLTQHPDPESGTTHPLGGREAWILGQTERAVVFVAANSAGLQLMMGSPRFSWVFRLLQLKAFLLIQMLFLCIPSQS